MLITILYVQLSAARVEAINAVLTELRQKKVKGHSQEEPSMSTPALSRTPASPVQAISEPVVACKTSAGDLTARVLAHLDKGGSTAAFDPVKNSNNAVAPISVVTAVDAAQPLVATHQVAEACSETP